MFNSLGQIVKFLKPKGCSSACQRVCFKKLQRVQFYVPEGCLRELQFMCIESYSNLSLPEGCLMELYVPLPYIESYSKISLPEVLVLKTAGSVYCTMFWSRKLNT